jgi:tape measure domain-containing protein
MGVQAASLDFVFGETGATHVNNQLVQLQYQYDRTRSSAIGFYQETERLLMSMQSLYAKELLVAKVTGDMTKALRMAAPAARDLLEWNRKLAILSPFSGQGVAEAYKMAQSFGFTTKETKRLTEATIDFATATGQSEQAMSRISLALGQMLTKGRVQGDEMLQLVNANVAAWEYLAKYYPRVGSELPYTVGEIRKLSEKGLLDARKAIKAILDGIEADFGGAAERSSETWAGLMDSWGDLQRYATEAFYIAAGWISPISTATTFSPGGSFGTFPSSTTRCQK